MLHVKRIVSCLNLEPWLLMAIAVGKRLPICRTAVTVDVHHVGPGIERSDSEECGARTRERVEMPAVVDQQLYTTDYSRLKPLGHNRQQG